MFDALVKEGETIQKKTRKAADEDGRRRRQGCRTWDRLERVFEDRVARALSSLGVPTKKDIDKLSKRVAELTAVVQQLTDAQEGAAKKVAKPAPKAAGSRSRQGSRDQGCAGKSRPRLKVPPSRRPPNLLMPLLVQQLLPR